MDLNTLPLRILLVDDEPANRKLLGDLVRYLGYRATAASGGVEALSIIENETVDCVLLDLRMPGMSGLEVLENLTARNITPALPVIVISGLADRESRIAALDRGAIDFISKPIDRNELEARLRSLSKMKQLKDTLAYREENLRVTLDSIGEAVLSTNAEGLVTRLNPVAEQLTGWTQAEAVGKPVTEVFKIADEGTRKARLIPLASTLSSSIVHRFENPTILLARDGKEYLINGSCASICESGKPNIGTVFVFRDITQERDLNLWYQTILETTIDGFMMYDRNGQILMVNPAYCQMSGYSKEELLGLYVKDLNGELSPEEVEKRIQSVRSKGSGQFESFHRRKDGSVYNVEIRAHYSKWLGGNVVAFIQDITKRKQAEAALYELNANLEWLVNDRTSALEESERRIRTLLGNLQGMAYRHRADETGTMEFVSEGVFDLLGLRPEEFTRGAVTLTDLIHPDDVEEMLTSSHRDLEMRKPWHNEYRVRHANGSWRWVWETSSGVYAEDGTLLFIEGFITDITEKKLAEFKLARSQKQFYDLFDFAPDAILMLNPQGKITLFNREAEKMFGYSKEELLGVEIEKLLPEYLWSQQSASRLPYFTDYVPKVLGSGVLEAKCIRQNGGEFPVSISGSSLETEEGIMVVAAVRDITEHISAANDRNAREAAEQASRAKSAFLANMSHEIRTPMNAILGFSQLLQRDTLLTTRQRGDVDIINRSAEHLLALINDVLEMSKIEAGQTQLNNAAFCLHHLFQDVHQMFTVSAENKGLELILEKAPDFPGHVIADERKLRQIFINLLGNAIKYTDQGKVTVRGGVQESDQSKDGLQFYLEVEDTGPGIPPMEQAKLFQTFGQGISGLKKGGTGLGLAISQKYARMMGGEITLKTEVGIGSCFRCTIPVKASEESQSQEQAITQRVVGLEPGAKAPRVLVVDDNLENRLLLKALLLPVGFQVKEVENGQEAVDAFDQWLPDAVLMDIRMPVMDGYEATRKIKATEAGRRTPILAISASVITDGEKEMRDSGAEDFIRKPFRPEELFTVLGRALHLQYVFAEQEAPAQPKPAPEVLSSEAISGLPEDLVRAMRDALNEGDMFRLGELTASVEAIDSAVALGLRGLADDYNYDRLANLLGQENS